MEGEVLWFNINRHYGMIEARNKEHYVFIGEYNSHYSPGTKVIFETEETSLKEMLGTKHYRAINIQRID